MPWGGATEDKQGWRVLFHEPGAALVRAPAAEDASVACKVDVFLELTIPSARTACAREALHSDEDWKKYTALSIAFATDYRRPPSGDGEVHRLLGHPDAIQGDMSRRLVYGLHDAHLDKPTPELEAEARELRLVFQIDSDHRANMMWGSLGRLYFWMRAADLEARRFEEALLQLQTT